MGNESDGDDATDSFVRRVFSSPSGSPRRKHHTSNELRSSPSRFDSQCREDTAKSYDKSDRIGYVDSDNSETFSSSRYGKIMEKSKCIPGRFQNDQSSQPSWADTRKKPTVLDLGDNHNKSSTKWSAAKPLDRQSYDSQEYATFYTKKLQNDGN